MSPPLIATLNVTELPNGALKVIVSTRTNRQGVGQHIRPGSPMHQALSHLSKANEKSHEIEAQRMSGIAGINHIRSVAACKVKGELRLAVVPA